MNHTEKVIIRQSIDIANSLEDSISYTSKMDNYYPMYDTVGSHYLQGTTSAETDSNKGEEKYYTKLLTGTKIDEDESRVYQEPHGSHNSVNRSSKKKMKCLTLGLVSIIIALLSLAIVGIVLTSLRWNKCNSMLSKAILTTSIQQEPDNCKTEQFRCPMTSDSNSTTIFCQTNINLTVSILCTMRTMLQFEYGLEWFNFTPHASVLY